MCVAAVVQKGQLCHKTDYFLLVMSRRDSFADDPLTNHLKQALVAADRALTCVWLTLTSDSVAELAAGAGFDCVLIDGEHSPSDIDTVKRQLMAAQCAGSPVVVRTPVNETWMIKRFM